MEAMPHLEKAYALSADSASRKATAAFCLGESCSSLGKTSEAAKFYCASVDALPNGRFAALALDRLNGASAINQKSYP
jgi:TolA-binding protein